MSMKPDHSIQTGEAWDAVVVGGGLAGLTAAAFLCRQGQRTLLVEKNEKTGGLVSTFTTDGFTFDGGIRAFEDSGIIFPMLKSLGIELEWLPNPVSIGFGTDWIRLESSDSLADYALLLAKQFPAHRADIDRIIAEIRKVMGYMDVIYGIENPLFRDDMKDLAYLRQTLLPWLLRYSANIRKAGKLGMPVREYLRRFTSSEPLIDMITQHFFQDTPTSFALSYFGLYLDYLYPRGGTGVLAEKITEYIREHGGEVRCSTAATTLDVENRTLGLGSGSTISYRELVWAADQQTLYRLAGGDRLGRLTPEARKQAELTASGRGSDSIFTLWLGVDREPSFFAEHLGPHAFYTPVTDGVSSLGSWQKAAANGTQELYRWLGDYLALTTYEISTPVLRDPAMAPPGRTGLIVSTLMDMDLCRRFSEADSHEAFKAFCADRIQAVLESSLIPGLREETLLAITASPLSIERFTGNKDGSITGWSFTNKPFPAENRFPKIAKSIETPLPHVLQCGQWTFSPAGLPVSILTGKLAADKADQLLGRKPS